jgi:hypothetical protein
MKQWSFDVRSWGPNQATPLEEVTDAHSLRRCPRNGASWHAGAWRVRTMVFSQILRLFSARSHYVIFHRCIVYTLNFSSTF